MINAISKKEYTGTNFDTLMLNGALKVKSLRLSNR